MPKGVTRKAGERRKRGRARADGAGKGAGKQGQGGKIGPDPNGTSMLSKATADRPRTLTTG
jgi:hypothetical protein